MRLNEILKDKGLTVYKINKLTGIPLTTLTDLVSGKADISKAYISTLYKLSHFLGVEIEDLVGEKIDISFDTFEKYKLNQILKGELFMKLEEELLSFLDYSHCEFLAIDYLKKLLNEAGYIELKECDNWNKLIKEGGKYFVTRNLASLIAFKIPSTINDFHYQISAAHSDSPTLKLKQEDDIHSATFNKLSVETYGGLILSSWLDKPLSIAGRIMVKNDSGEIESRLIDINKDLMIIPNTCIHFNRSINDGYKYNPNVDMFPIISLSEEKNSIKLVVSKELGINEAQIYSYDLYLYNRTKPTIGGLNNEFLMSSKIDNLESSYLCIKGLIDSEENNVINLACVFNNEEVGSRTINGADSTFLSDVLNRIAMKFNKLDNQYEALNKSFILSVDNAHAIHPNHPELSDNNSPVYLNKGVVIKQNSNQSYTTDALSLSVVKLLCEQNDIPYQLFYNRSDIRGGGTLGAISLSHVSIHSCDIGLSQLAMHSSYEVGGTVDILYMYNLMKNYYSKNIEISDDKVKI